jgi:hypothetical protein
MSVIDKNYAVSSLVDELDIVVVPAESAIGKSLDEDTTGSLTVTVSGSASATVTITLTWAFEQEMMAG